MGACCILIQHCVSSISLVIQIPFGLWWSASSVRYLKCPFHPFDYLHWALCSRNMQEYINIIIITYSTISFVSSLSSKWWSLTSASSSFLVKHQNCCLQMGSSRVGSNAFWWWTGRRRGGHCAHDSSEGHRQHHRSTGRHGHQVLHADRYTGVTHGKLRSKWVMCKTALVLAAQCNPRK